MEGFSLTEKQKREAQLRLEISRDLECHSESIGVLDWRLCILEIWIENFEF